MLGKSFAINLELTIFYFKDQKSPRDELGRNFSLLELKMEVYVTRLRELEWEREQLLADRKEKLHAARQNKVKVAN